MKLPNMYELRKEYFNKEFQYPHEIIAISSKRKSLEFMLNEIDPDVEFYALHPNKGSMYVKQGDIFKSNHLVYFIEKTSIVILN